MANKQQAQTEPGTAAEHAILFEPVQIGPVLAPNRFYQVPHCTGMGYRYPRTEARLRGVKAEGGWGVVSTQETEIHPTSDLSPCNEGRLWDESDIPALRLMTDAVHEHGSLAAVQLVHNGLHTSNRYSRQLPLAPSAAVVDLDDPVQAREMSLHDITTFRRWHREAAGRARDAGFDIVYVYAGHNMTLLQHFLLSRHNHRSDQYGGSFRNRLRLFSEVLEDTRDAVGETCAVAVRLAVDELMGSEGIEFQAEGRDIIEALAEVPDLWDVNLSDWSNDSQSSRFSQEGYQDSYTRFVKSVTSRPVVGVGRYTSPDTMAGLIKTGHLDFIGAARPSIADPFLPHKIKQGRIDDIRECIGCNICISGDNTNVPMRCTQNPTIGEEWRRNWHPENIPPLERPEHYLIIGGGPSGLEAGRALLQRGASITIADKATRWGGRVSDESRLPGLASWARVRDWRLGQIQQTSRASLYLQSIMSADDIIDYGADHVVIATGAYWRRDGVGRSHRQGLPFMAQQNILTPDDIYTKGHSCITKKGPVVVFDDDRFYLGSVIAEYIADSGFETIYLTPSPIASAWSVNTLEQTRIQRRLMNKNVRIIASHTLSDFKDLCLSIKCNYTQTIQAISCATLLSITARLPNDSLWDTLSKRQDQWVGIKSVTRVGDCLAPGLIATACQSGHAYARAAGTPVTDCKMTDSTIIRRDDQVRIPVRNGA